MDMESKMGYTVGFCRWRCERGRANARNVSFIIFMRQTLINLLDAKFSWSKVVARSRLRSRSYMLVETVESLLCSERFLSGSWATQV